MKLALALVALAVCAALLFIRFAPSDIARWHIDPGDANLRSGGGAFHTCTGGDPAKLARLDAVALATPRTKRLAGSLEEGRITWITRSALMGFPDYTTAAVIQTPEGPRLCLYARLRFGLGDLGTNQARARSWLSIISP